MGPWPDFLLWICHCLLHVDGSLLSGLAIKQRRPKAFMFLKTVYNALPIRAVLNLLRLEDHFQILSLGRGQPLNIEVPKWSICVLISLKNNPCSRTTRQMVADFWWSADHRLRTG